MKSYSRAHLSDEVLLRDLATATARERSATAEVLALIAEVDERKLYLPAGYPSMLAYCVGELHFSEDDACRSEVAQLLAERLPQSDTLTWVMPIPAATPTGSDDLSALEQIEMPSTTAPGNGHPATRPLSAQSFAVQFTISRSAHEKLRYAQELLGRPTGDIAQVFEQAMDALIPKLE